MNKKYYYIVIIIPIIGIITFSLWFLNRSQSDLNNNLEIINQPNKSAKTNGKPTNENKNQSLENENLEKEVVNTNVKLTSDESLSNTNKENKTREDTKIIFLHHSTGENIWNGGVENWFGNYNSQNNTNYQISEQNFPKGSPYGWENYPYDYWNIWVNHTGNQEYLNEPTLEILSKQYDIIVFKHCFPVSDIETDSENPNIGSSDKTVKNYQLQYQALKIKMLEFPNNKFIVWTGAAPVQNATTELKAKRAKEFFSWVKNEWDEPKDNIFVWDFYQLETEGGLYLKNEYAESPNDSHPNIVFSQKVAPYLSQRIVDIIEGKGDNSSLTGFK